MNLVYIQGENEKAQGIHYEIDTDIAPLGEGGMGVVYRGVRVESNGIRRDVAVKFLFNDLPESAITRARREASIQIHNENLVEMFGFIETQEQSMTHYHVVSELLHGVMLSDLLKGVITDKNGETIAFAADLHRQYREDPAHFALFITKCVLSGVMALHDKGYVHRDIDPSNIMITSSGNIKLIDFGIAKVIDKKNSAADIKLTISGQFLGKPCYASPELATGDVPHQNQQTDLYAIGIMLYQLIVGKVPFDGPLTEVLEMQIKQKMPLQDVPYRSVRKIINKATQKKQSDRYRSAAEFRADIEQIEDEDFSKTISMSGSTAASQLITSMTGGVKPSSNLRTIIITSCACIALLVVFCLWSLPTSGTETDITNSGEFLHVDTIRDPILVDPTLEGIKYKLLQVEHASEGLIELREMISKGGNESDQAAVLLASLYDKSSRHSEDSDYLTIKENLGQFPEEGNYQLMHNYDSIAVQLNPACYAALYELAVDYTMSERGFGVNKDKAIEYAQQALDAAQQAGASDIVDKCNRIITMFN